MIGIGSCLALLLVKGASIVVSLRGGAAGSTGIVPTFGVLATLVIASLVVVRRALQQHQLDRAQLMKNPWQHIQRWEDQLLIITLLPMVAARTVGLCSSLTSPALHHSLFYPTCLVSSMLLLLLLRPQRAHFIGTCIRCKQPVPIAVASFGSCMQCDTQLRDSFLGRRDTDTQDGNTAAPEGRKR